MRDLHLCSLVPQPHLLYILWKAGLVFDIDFVGLWSYVPSRNMQLNLCSEQMAAERCGRGRCSFASAHWQVCLVHKNFQHSSRVLLDFLGNNANGSMANTHLACTRSVSCSTFCSIVFSSINYEFTLYIVNNTVISMQKTSVKSGFMWMLTNRIDCAFDLLRGVHVNAPLDKYNLIKLSWLSLLSLMIVHLLMSAYTWVQVSTRKFLTYSSGFDPIW